ncbi:hypothetical protein [Nocardia sp. NPDC057227]|uniref:hypothetical protein n=1 Tax=Nocardia sp. NPDC057227 TaxID=3346056 RepID=UPI00362FF5FF
MRLRSRGSARAATEPDSRSLATAVDTALWGSPVHPQQLHTLIAHEPVAPSLLAAPDRAAHLRELEHCQQVFHAEGWRAALAPVARSLGIDPIGQDIEPEIRLPALTAERAADFGHFLVHDLTAVRADRLDVVALQRSSVRVVPAVGSTTPAHVFDRKCAAELAALLDTGIATFAGGHNGSMTHPRANAMRLSALPGCRNDVRVSAG